MEKSILNIMPDDKFIDAYIRMSEDHTPDGAAYLVYTDEDSLRYVKTRHKNLRVVPTDAKQLSLAVREIRPSVVVFHGFKKFHADFIKGLPPEIRKVWIFWGYEGYAAFSTNRYISPATHRLLYPTGLTGFASYVFSRTIRSLYTMAYQQITRSIIKSMDYCATWVKEDLVLAQSLHPGIKTLYFNYYTPERVGASIPAPMPKSGTVRIFLGNSASPTNNHIEALRYLKDIGYDGEIVCSLSYGGDKLYVDNLIREAKALFGERFIPLREFMPLEEYQGILNSCQVVWMNHKRQQAAGNIFSAFAHNKVLILHPESPMRSSLDEWGLRYYDKSIIHQDSLPSKELLNTNRDIILEKLNPGYNRNFFDTLFSID